MADIGAQTPFFYIFRERELVYDLFEAVTKEPDSVNNIEEEWNEYLIEVIVFALVDMLFRHLNLRGSRLDK